MEKLSFMRGLERFTCFEFQKNDSVDHYIGIIRSDGLSVEPDRKRELLMKLDSAFFENDYHRPFIHSFEKTKAQFVVDLIKNANDLFGQF